MGSYGKQLGCILKALDVIVSRFSEDKLLPEERLALSQLQDLSSHAKSAVAEFKGRSKEGITEADIDFLIRGLESLARSKPDLHRSLVERIQKAMATQGGTRKR